jgi:hypothetical protein
MSKDTDVNTKNLIDMIKKIIMSMFNKKDTENKSDLMSDYEGSNPLDDFLASRISVNLSVIDRFFLENAEAGSELLKNKEFGKLNDLIDDNLIRDVESLIDMDIVEDELLAYPKRRSNEVQRNSVESIMSHLDRKKEHSLSTLPEGVLNVYVSEINQPPFSRAEELSIEIRYVSKTDKEILKEYKKMMNSDNDNDNKPKGGTFDA